MPQVALSSGNLDRIIVLQRAQTAKNGLGEPVQTWGDLNIVWANKVDQIGVEAVRGDQVAAVVRTQFLVRYADTVFSPPLNPADRLLYNEAGGPPEEGAVYNIIAIQEVGRRQGRLITCQARADQVLG